MEQLTVCCMMYSWVSGSKFSSTPGVLAADSTGGSDDAMATK
jgi:hypothetical protein